MRTKTAKNNPTIKELSAEVNMLRSFVIGLAGRDPEGEYRPEFVGKVLESAKEPATDEFVSAKDFLSRLSRLEKKE